MRYEQNFAIIARRMVIAITREIEAAAQFVDMLCLYRWLPSMSWAPAPALVCVSTHTSGSPGTSALRQTPISAMRFASIDTAAGNASSGSARSDIGSSDTRTYGVKPLQNRCPAKRNCQG